jgi:hypothetical protein
MLSTNTKLNIRAGIGPAIIVICAIIVIVTTRGAKEDKILKNMYDDGYRFTISYPKDTKNEETVMHAEQKNGNNAALDFYFLDKKHFEKLTAVTSGGSYYEWDYDREYKYYKYVDVGGKDDYVIYVIDGTPPDGVQSTVSETDDVMKAAKEDYNFEIYRLLDGYGMTKDKKVRGFGIWCMEQTKGKETSIKPVYTGD